MDLNNGKMEEGGNIDGQCGAIEDCYKLAGERQIIKRKPQFTGHFMRGSCSEQTQNILEGKYVGPTVILKENKKETG